MSEKEAETQAAEEAPAPEATTSATTTRSDTRYPLAFDVNGNPVQVPPNAVAWRVRRGGGKRGRPRNVFDTTTGRQLEIALGASIEDLGQTNVPPGRYLLYPVDEQGAIITGIVAVTELTESDDDDDDDEQTTITSPSLPKDPWPAALATVERIVASYERNLASQHDVIKEAMQNHSKSLERAVSGYAPVRPVLPPAAPAAPMIVEHAAAAAPPAQPSDTLGSIAALLNNPAMLNNLFMIAQNVVTMFRSATAAGAAAVGGSPERRRDPRSDQ